VKPITTRLKTDMLNLNAFGCPSPSLQVSAKIEPTIEVDSAVCGKVVPLRDVERVF